MADLPTERQFGDYGTWPGRDVLDPDGERLGAVREIYLDRETHQPEWVLVDVNEGDARFVPLADAAIDDAAIRVAHRRDAVAAAPGIGAEPRIDPEQERRLYAHYGVPFSDEQSSTVLPQTDTAASEYAAATPDPKPGEEEQAEGWAAPRAAPAPAAAPEATTPGATPAAAVPPPDPLAATQPESAVPEPQAAVPEPPPAAPAWETTAPPQPETAAAPPPDTAPAWPAEPADETAAAPPADTGGEPATETPGLRPTEAAAAPTADTGGEPPTETPAAPPTETAAAPQTNGATTPQPEPALPPAPEPPRLPPPGGATHDESLLDKARSQPALVAAILAALALLFIVRRLRD